jgi:hypothetical protein
MHMTCAHVHNAVSSLDATWLSKHVSVICAVTAGLRLSIARTRQAASFRFLPRSLWPVSALQHTKALQNPIQWRLHGLTREDFVYHPDDGLRECLRCSCRASQFACFSMPNTWDYLECDLRIRLQCDL